MTEQQKDQITQMRVDGLGYLKISQLLSLSINTVKTYCRRNGLRSEYVLPVEIPADNYVNLNICRNCGKTVDQKAMGKRKKFCSDHCRVTWWNNHLNQVNRKAYYLITCQRCHKTFTSYGNKDRKYCSHACYITDRFRKDWNK